MSRSETYRGWNIEFVHPPIPTREYDYCATHDDWEPGDPRHVDGPTVEVCRQRIDEWYEANPF